MIIGIISAMVEEVEPFLDLKDAEDMLHYFDHYEDVRYAGRTYHQINYRGHKIVLVYSKIGKVNAALTAATLIEKFGAEMVLFSGVAGAIDPALKIGDLIAATQLCQHDLDITAFGHPYGYVPEGKVYVEPDRELMVLAKKVADEKGIELKAGIIATGDQFVADPERKEWIRQTFQAHAIEMEGAAVASVCDDLNVPFFVLRAISDAADMDAAFDFDEFLKHSSKVSSDFMMGLVDKIIDDRTQS